MGIQNSFWGIIKFAFMKHFWLGLFIYRFLSLSSVDNNEKLNQALPRVHQISNITQLLLIGDFNYPRINCSSLIVSCSDRSPAMHF